jgi:hypothetical protein
MRSLALVLAAYLATTANAQKPVATCGPADAPAIVHLAAMHEDHLTAWDNPRNVAARNVQRAMIPFATALAKQYGARGLYAKGQTPQRVVENHPVWNRRGEDLRIFGETFVRDFENPHATVGVTAARVLHYRGVLELRAGEDHVIYDIARENSGRTNKEAYPFLLRRRNEELVTRIATDLYRNHETAAITDHGAAHDLCNAIEQWNVRNPSTPVRGIRYNAPGVTNAGQASATRAKQRQ